MSKGEVIAQIREAFVTTPHLGDGFLQGSFDGCEPYDEVGAFVGKSDWSKLDSTILDGHYRALSFFSEGGFRFFLPAYLIADLREELLTADSLFSFMARICNRFDRGARRSAEVSSRLWREKTPESPTLWGDDME